MIGLISKYRTELMGLASIWVALYHYTSELSVNILHYISIIGYGGVDIFLFLSGFGLTYGYKNKSVGSFYLKRFLRIYPTFLIITFLDYFLKHNFSIRQILLASTGIGYFFPHRGFPDSDWYIAFLYLLYLVFPLWMWLNHQSQKWSYKYILTCIASLIGILWALKIVHDHTGQMTILAATRVPIFFIGSLFGFFYIKHTELKRKSITWISLLSIISYLVLIICIETCNFMELWVYGMLWFPLITMIPGVILMLAYGLKFIPNCVNSLLHYLGSCSLEFYLLHCMAIYYLKKYMLELIQQYPYMTFILFVIIMLCTALQLRGQKRWVNYDA